MNRQVFYTAFGFDKERPVLIGLMIILQFLFAPYNELCSFAMTWLGRRFEFQVCSGLGLECISKESYSHSS